MDSCVPRRLEHELAGHHVRTAGEMGWGDLDDGPLLDAMQQQFDVLISVDKSLPKQQNLAKRPFGTLILRAKTNRFADLQPLVPTILAAIPELKPGEVRELVA